jgi:hypothetical protein
MKLSAFQKHLQSLSALNIRKPDGTFVPPHFHITEAGLITKNFIDCGGTIRSEKAVNLQVWVAHDTDHRLSPEKLLGILTKSEKLFNQEDPEVEVEYQTETIGKYGIDFIEGNLQLVPKHTECLAQDHCGIPQEKPKIRLSQLQEQTAVCCTPGGGCC